MKWKVRVTVQVCPTTTVHSSISLTPENEATFESSALPEDAAKYLFGKFKEVLRDRNGFLAFRQLNPGE